MLHSEDFFYLNELPLPLINSESTIYKNIIDLSGVLMCQNRKDFSDLKKRLKLSYKTCDDKETTSIRSKLEALMANVFGLNYNELEYILSTFPVENEELKKRILEQFNSL